MKRRIFFHFINFVFLGLIIFVALIIYSLAGASSLSTLKTNVFRFCMIRWPNLVLMYGLTYFAIYVSGLVYTSGFRGIRGFGNFLSGIFRFFLVLGVVSFIEFFVFFESKVGRVIYLIVFLLWSLQFFVRQVLGKKVSLRRLHWVSAESPDAFENNFFELNQKFDLTDSGMRTDRINVSEWAVFRNEEMTDALAEKLIRYKLQGCRILEVKQLIELEEERIPLDYVSSEWLLEQFNCTNKSYLRLSRWLNCALALVLLALLFPPAFLAALVHCLFSPGPIFFRQTRVGLMGREIALVKFRTMDRNAESNGACYSGQNDSRVNGWARIMRKVRLDEVPQLLNVIRGEMNLVGPRPEREVFIKELEKNFPFYRLRLLVKPGLTGWAQVKMGYAGYDKSDQKKKLEYDLYYIKNRSMIFDLMILVKTVPVVLCARGN